MADPKLDYKNAFNTLRRDKMLSAVLEFAPDLFPFVHSAYSEPSFLFFGEHILSSAFPIVLSKHPSASYC